MKKSYPGINIQWPISELIIRGEKVIETRTYTLPLKYINQEMVLVETPGPDGDFAARARAIIVFTECFKYESSKKFYADQKRHCVDKASKWAWKKSKPKWGWKVKVIKILKQPYVLVPNKGIIYTSSVIVKN